LHENTVGQGLFVEDFKNDGKKDSPLSRIGWHANYGATGKAVSESNTGFAQGPVFSWVDYIVYDLDPVQFGAAPFLLWTDKAAAGSIDEVSSIGFSMKTDGGPADLKIAIRVDDAWYVSQNVLNPEGAGWTTHAVDVHTAAWNRLSFIPEKHLAEEGAARLPGSGTITAVGVFDADETSVKTRVDNFIVR
jgi:hypothetical protein